MAVITVTLSPAATLPPNTAITLGQVTRDDTGATVGTFSPAQVGPAVWTWTNTDQPTEFHFSYTVLFSNGQTFVCNGTSRGGAGSPMCSVTAHLSSGTAAFNGSILITPLDYPAGAAGGFDLTPVSVAVVNGQLSVSLYQSTPYRIGEATFTTPATSAFVLPEFIFEPTG